MSSHTVLSISETTRSWAEQRQMTLVYESETGSTNDNAKRNAFSDGAASVLYLATHQTQGRGRGQNTWLDTGNGECLLSTWSYSVASSPQSITAPRIGLALFKAVRAVWPSLEWSLKAPNDLFLNGAKIGGLLVETVSSGDRFRLIIGLGLNVLNHPRRFAEAEHLSDTPSEGEWFQFLDELHAEFGRAVNEALQPALADSARRELMHALNANAAKKFTVLDVSPQGDLHHADGHVAWTDL